MWFLRGFYFLIYALTGICALIPSPGHRKNAPRPLTTAGLHQAFGLYCEGLLLKKMTGPRLTITLSKKTCSAFNLGNFLWLETVKVALLQSSIREQSPENF
jgi:hypothetical protein